MKDSIKMNPMATDPPSVAIAGMKEGINSAHPKGERGRLKK
jgi:hypothetical protein